MSSRVNRGWFPASVLSVAFAWGVGCGGTTDVTEANQDEPSSNDGTMDMGAGGAANTDSDPITGQGGNGDGGGAVVMPVVPDPAEAGPYDIAEIDSALTAGDDSVAVHAVYPTNASGPLPVVIFGNGFRISPTQYYGYLDRLASHGFIALTVELDVTDITLTPPFFEVNHPRGAEQLIAGIDWVLAEPTLGPLADATKIGLTGHSLGGKLAVLGASIDDRVAAAFGIDPVDGGAPGCGDADCPDASATLPLDIPTGFLGETVDATGALQACAPAAENFATFYAEASTPTYSIELVGANHYAFIEDVNSCTACGFASCNPSTANPAEVLQISQTLTTAFFLRHLVEDTEYETFLSGSEATTRYVDTGKAIIATK